MRIQCFEVRVIGSQICRNWGRNTWRSSGPLYKHLKVINQTDTLLNKDRSFHPALRNSTIIRKAMCGLRSIRLQFSTGMCWCMWEEPAYSSPALSPRNGPVLNQALLCRHPSTLPTPLQTAFPLPIAQAREVTTCRSTSL